jgi:hypothetical protein
MFNHLTKHLNLQKKALSLNSVKVSIFAKLSFDRAESRLNHIIKISLHIS